MYSYFDFTTLVTPFGLIFIAAIFVTWCFARWNVSRTRVHPSHVDLLIPVTIIAGIAGGTVLAMLVPTDQALPVEGMNPGPRVRFFAILGTGAIGLFIYSRVAHLSFRGLLDVFALPTLAGLMIHRVGCYLAGCCWGDVVDGAVRGVQFPPGSLAYEQHGALGLIEPGAVASLPVYPVQIYEAVLLAALLLILIQVPWRRVPRGTLAILAIAAYAVMRFFIEYLRADAPVVLGNLTVTQLQCIILAFSIVLLPRLRGRVVS